jgi:hypothetical protein
MRLLRHGVVPALCLSTVQPEGPGQHFQVQLLHMENVFVFQSRVCPQHGNISLPGQLILFVVALYHSPHNTLDIMEGTVSDIESLEEALETVVNEVFVYILEGLVLVVIPDLLGVI